MVGGALEEVLELLICYREDQEVVGVGLGNGMVLTARAVEQMRISAVAGKFLYDVKWIWLGTQVSDGWVIEVGVEERNVKMESRGC